MSAKQVAYNLIAGAVSELYGLKDAEIQISIPDNETHGDYSANTAFSIAKKLNRIPLEVAKEIAAEALAQNLSVEFGKVSYPIFEKIEACAPGFVNFTLSRDFLFHTLIGINTEENYGRMDFGSGKKIILEYSQPNTNKPQHVGHARNNFIGSSLAKILEYCGYDVVKANYVGDIGIHICKSMLMYMKYGDGQNPDKKPDHFVGDFYSMYEAEYEKNPGIEAEAQDLLRRWEAGEPEVLAVWEKMNSWVYDGWKKTYSDQKVDFDIWEYESEKVDIGKEMAMLALDKGLAEKDDTGAIIARLEAYGMPDKVLLRSDGTSVYSTKDLQLAKDSYDKYKFDKRLYVVDVRQSDYFRQLFKVLELLGFEWHNRLVHVAYGMVSLPEGKMSSRSGVVANADDVLDNLSILEEAEVRNNIKSTGIIRETAQKIALAAFKYGILKVDTKQDIVFNYDQASKFEGNTGPYLLYTYARAGSVLEKAGFDPDSEKFTYAELPKDTKMQQKELSLASCLTHFPEYVEEAAVNYSPGRLANYTYEVAQKFNSFYGDVTILDAESVGARKFRLYLTRAAMSVLKESLALLGIEVVEKM